ncbi:hypothetical protein [Stenotrophomonas rhizophila]
MAVYTRSEFYDLLWSAPASKLAKDLGISDVALGKVAKRHGIPAPERGYWAKVAAGKRAVKKKLPPRGLGQSDSIHVGREQARIHSSAVGPDVDIPPLPAPLSPYEESLDDLLARLGIEIGTVSVPKSLAAPHSVVAKMLEIDAKRTEKFAESGYRWSHEQPYYASPFEKRRLRILSAIFKAVATTGLSLSAKGKNAYEFHVYAPEGTSITFRLDHPKQTSPRDSYFATSKPDRPASDPLKLEIQWHWRSTAPFRSQWQDEKGKLLEDELSEISATLAMAVEAAHRQWKSENRLYRIQEHERAVRLAEETRLQAIRDKEAKIEAERHGRILKLFKDAEAFRVAEDIRSYVAAVVQANAQSPSPAAWDEIAAWRDSALACADDIDPVLSKAFLLPPSPLAELVPDPMPAAPPTPVGILAETDRPWHPNRFLHFNRQS